MPNGCHPADDTNQTPQTVAAATVHRMDGEELTRDELFNLARHTSKPTVLAYHVLKQAMQNAEDEDEVAI